MSSDARHRLLIVDDEEAVREACRSTLEREPLAVCEADSGAQALALLARRQFDVVILDLKMPGIDGMEVLSRIKAEHPHTAVVVITGYATVESAVDAMKRGADDFLPKPFTPESLRIIVRRCVSGAELVRENRSLKYQLSTRNGGARLVGDSPQMKAIHDLIRRVAPTDATVLITGESGTGKELVARAVHQHSGRASKPFVVVDCTTLVGTLFESELFGHVKGAFTGASATTHGRAEMADGGTLFFDEISSIDLPLQGKLLRLIQEREFTRVGSNQVVSVDVRIVAATNRNLLKDIEEGRFREDLYYRLIVVPIVLPPLRQRREDIPALGHYFLERHNRGRGRDVKRISPQAMEILMALPWSGNVRELENAVERAVVLTDGDEIVPSDLLWYGANPEAGSAADEGPVSGVPMLTLDEMERRHIHRTLRHLGGNRARAAQCLGIDRKTLWRKLRRYGQAATDDRGE